jgi:hypothetical protein
MGANTPMHNTGSVVSVPIAAFDKPRSPAIVGTSGGTAAITVRRLPATATRLSAKSQTGGR